MQNSVGPLHTARHALTCDVYGCTGDPVHTYPSSEYAYAATVLFTHSLGSSFRLYACHKMRNTPSACTHKNASSREVVADKPTGFSSVTKVQRLRV